MLRGGRRVRSGAENVESLMETPCTGSGWVASGQLVRRRERGEGPCCARDRAGIAFSAQLLLGFRDRPTALP